MTQLQVADDFEFPLDLVVQQTGILARTGAGKTNTAVVIAEEVLAAGQQLVIVDPPGAWFGLRSSADGTKPGYSIVVLGGEHGDLPLDPGAGQVIADVIVDEDASVILDLSEFSGRELTTFVTAFAERLYRRKGVKRDAMLLIIEEADEVAPQMPMPDQRRMLGAIERIVKRGRMRGIGTLLITQRSASLNKNALSQIEVLIAMQTTAPQDIKAIDEWVKQTGDQECRQELLAEIASLPIGTAFVWSPAWLRTFRKVHFRKRRTFDSSATPKPGQRAIAPKHRAEVDLEGLRERMAATIEKAKADDPKELRRRIAELERELTHRPTEQRTERVVERVEVPVIDKDEIAEFRRLVDALLDTGTQLGDAARSIGSALDRVSTSPRTPVVRPRSAEPSAQLQPPQEPSANGHTPLKAGAVRMVETLARHYPTRLTRAQLGTLSGFTPSGGTFSTYFSQLKRLGLVQESGGDVEITAAGFAFLGDRVPEAPHSTEELQQMWHDALPKRGARDMLDELVSVYPRAISREELGERTGFTVSGGTFSTYLGMLRRNGLIEESGSGVRASDALFVAGGLSERE